ncbi:MULTISPECIES: hypothetical protein [Pseudoalteromonas]|uniref:Uncharacterized protein n=1 Tax=Pseudoalteromonas amylolytica TaxID=1859457 RepID=A0A1S1N197_9GAMM|nr:MULTISPECIES: hypothetical protein [Pseudoalteromonas]OHU89045.1 hypothetical protein BFC16_05190 [Pseudoalteromonas sp. JW3]OHU91945.1 hypothetical protein BET10_06295 [Pseudoalteromonas amylolytica]
MKKLHLKKKKVNYEIVLSFFFSCQGVYWYFNENLVDYGKEKVLYFLTPFFIIYFIYSLYSYFKVVKGIFLTDKYVCFDGERISLDELESLSFHFFYSCKNRNWIRKVRVDVKRKGQADFRFSGHYSVNLKYENILEQWGEYGNIIFNESE